MQKVHTLVNSFGVTIFGRSQIFSVGQQLEIHDFLHIVLLYKLEVKTKLFALLEFRRGFNFPLGETQCQSVGVE